ncbi:hypothetical protein ACIBHX_31120 [Nonomuraea sp. NPDC050536]|uniref:hypothetical protein n=1 Tax=Nonomuraea sp. NPDC050536 TaxID=3364366 RepID=UPI0037C9F4B8
MAVTVDGRHRPVLALAWCDEQPTFVVVDRRGARGVWLETVRLTAPKLQGKSARVSLAEAADGWVIARGKLEFDVGATYRVAAAGKTPYSSFSSVDFRPAEFGSMRADKMLVQQRDQKDAEVDVLLTPQEFEASARSSCPPR